MALRLSMVSLFGTNGDVISYVILFNYPYKTLTEKMSCKNYFFLNDYFFCPFCSPTLDKKKVPKSFLIMSSHYAINAFEETIIVLFRLNSKLDL
jgi:hypothetical protein